MFLEFGPRSGSDDDDVVTFFFFFFPPIWFALALASAAAARSARIFSRSLSLILGLYFGFGRFSFELVCTGLEDTGSFEDPRRCPYMNCNKIPQFSKGNGKLDT